jgi:hypothetical protein
MSRGLVNNMLTMNNLGDGSTLSLDFTTMGGVLDPRLTFSRASTATFVNSSGYVEWAGANIVLQSGDLSQNGVGQWTTRTNLTLTGWSGISDPFGGSTAVKIIPNTTNATHNVGTADISMSIGIPYTVSVYVKAAGYSIVGLVTTNSNARAHFNLATQTSAGYGVTNTRTITDVGNGWYRITMSFTVANGPLVSLLIYAMNTATDPVANSFAGVSASTDGVLAWGAQLNPGSTAQTYYPTTTAAYHAPRFDYSPTNIGEPRGLLIEGSAINVCTYSQAIAGAGWNTTTGYTVTTNTPDLLSPAGDNTATKLVYTSGYARCIQTVTLAANTTYTMSYWIKSVMTHTFRVYDLTAGADIASSIGSIPVTSSWTRVQKTFTTGASTSSCWFYVANDGGPTAGMTAYVWGAQVELGSGASSYIPTGASQVTRNADSCVMTGTNFSSWFAGATEGVLFAEYEKPRSQSGNAAHDFMAIGSRYTTGAGFIVYASNSNYYPTAILWPTGGAVFGGGIATAIPSVTKQAAKWFGGNDVTNYSNGVVGTTGAGTGTLTPAMLSFGANSATGTEATRDWLNACIRQVKFYPSALPNAQIQALTTP